MRYGLNNRSLCSRGNRVSWSKPMLQSNNARRWSSHVKSLLQQNQDIEIGLCWDAWETYYCIYLGSFCLFQGSENNIINSKHNDDNFFIGSYAWIISIQLTLCLSLTTSIWTTVSYSPFGSHSHVYKIQHENYWHQKPEPDTIKSFARFVLLEELTIMLEYHWLCLKGNRATSEAPKPQRRQRDEPDQTLIVEGARHRQPSKKLNGEQLQHDLSDTVIGLNPQLAILSKAIPGRRRRMEWCQWWW